MFEGGVIKANELPGIRASVSRYCKKYTITSFKEEEIWVIIFYKSIQERI